MHIHTTRFAHVIHDALVKLSYIVLHHSTEEYMDKYGQEATASIGGGRFEVTSTLDCYVMPMESATITMFGLEVSIQWLDIDGPYANIFIRRQ